MCLDKKSSLLILNQAKGLGRAGLLKLMAHFGSLEAIANEGWNPFTRILFNKWPVENWESNRDSIEEAHINLISFEDPDYPKNLLTIKDFPLILYVKGEIKPADATAIALIGTRNATLYGKEKAFTLAKELAEHQVCIVSGLARGIDTEAHLGALNGAGRTLAVIGSGLAHIYPKENEKLAEKIADNGAVISEYPMHMPPAKGLFPRRNRIVSGLSKGVCLIESSLDGGGMITMKQALEQKRALFALPGRVDWPTFAGNHALIKEQTARLIENGADLLKALGFEKKEKIGPSLQLSPEESQLLQALKGPEKSIDELVLLTQFPIMQLNVLLTRLILKKAVIEFPGKVYKSR